MDHYFWVFLIIVILVMIIVQVIMVWGFTIDSVAGIAKRERTGRVANQCNDICWAWLSACGHVPSAGKLIINHNYNWRLHHLGHAAYKMEVSINIFILEYWLQNTSANIQQKDKYLLSSHKFRYSSRSCQPVPFWSPSPQYMH